MLDRRPEEQILRELQDQQQRRRERLQALRQHAGAVVSELRPHARLVEILVVIWIVAVLAALLLPTFMRARTSAYLATCLEQLRTLGQAMEMYAADHYAYPPAYTWHVALRPYLTAPGTEQGAGEEDWLPRRAQVTTRDPLRCPADKSNEPVSYYYLDLALLPSRGPLSLGLAETPTLVDEVNHPGKVPVLWYDHHQTALDLMTWAHLRTDLLRIRVDREHPGAYCYLPRETEPALGGSP